MQRLPLVLFFLLLANPALSSPAVAVTTAAKDIDTISEEDKPNALYLWHPPRGVDKAIADFEIIQKYRVNKVSRKYTKFFDPVRIPMKKEEGALWRVDISEYNWSRAVLDKASLVSPYFHDRDNLVSVPERIRARPNPTRNFMRYPKGTRKQMRPVRPPAMKLKGMLARKKIAPPNPDLPVRDITHLMAETQSDAPILHAQWFIYSISRQLSLRNQEDGVGYYDILGIKDRKGFFRLVGLNEKEALEDQREIRAALDDSKLTGKKGRQVFKLDGRYGAVFGTLDTSRPFGKGIAIRSPKRGDYDHDAEEYFGPLNNGLDAQGLFNKDGKNQAVAPDFVGQNKSALNTSLDLRIHVGQCLTCHDNVLKPVNDYFRRTFLTRPKRFKTKLARLEFESQYFSDLDEALDTSIKSYIRKTQLATVTVHTPKGLTLKQAVTLDAQVLFEYSEGSVTPEIAAADLGTTPFMLLLALKLAEGTVEGVDDAFAPFLDDIPKGITRLIWEDSFHRAQFYLRGIPK